MNHLRVVPLLALALLAPVTVYGAICPTSVGPTANPDSFTVASSATIDASSVVANDLDPDGRLTVLGVDTTGTVGTVHISYTMATRGGLDGYYYTVPAATALLTPDAGGHIPLESTTAAACALTTSLNFPTIDVNSFAPFATIGTSNIEAMFVGFVDIPTTGTYTFATSSDDGSALWIDANLDGVFEPTEEIVNNNNFQGVVTVSNPVTLAAGAYPIRIGYFQGGGGASFRVQWKQPGDVTLSDIPANSLGTATATILYTPPAIYHNIVGTNETDVFHYTVRNQSGGTSTAAVNININGVTTTDEDTPLAILNASQTAPDGSPLVITAINTAGTLGAITTSPAVGIGGLTGRYFDFSSSPGTIATALLTPDPSGNIPLESATPTVTAATPTVNFPTIDTTSYAPIASGMTMNTAALWTGWIQIPVTGTYTFATKSDDGSALWVDVNGDGVYQGAEEIVNNDNFQGATQITGNVTLNAGIYRIRIGYFQGGGGASMVASWQKPGDVALSPIPASAFGLVGETATYDPTVAFNHLSVGTNAPDHFTYTLAAASGFTLTVPATLTITGVNDPPTATSDSYSTDEDTPLVIASSGVLANDTDPDSSDVLTVSTASTTSTLGASVAVAAGGGFTYDPRGSATLQALATGALVSDTFTYTASDGHGGQSTATVTIHVTGVNDPPFAVADSSTATRDALLSVPTPGVLSNDHDPDTGDTLTVSASDPTSTLGATVVVHADGSFTYDPRPSTTLQALGTGQTASDTFHYTVRDVAGATSTTTVTITVNGAAALLVMGMSTATLSPVPLTTPITYDLMVTNNGPASAANVAVQDPLPAPVDFVSSTCGSMSGSTFVWTIGTMAASAQATCSVTVAFQRLAPQIINAATVSSDVTDPNAPTSTASTTLAAVTPAVPVFSPAALALLLAALAAVGLSVGRK